MPWSWHSLRVSFDIIHLSFGCKSGWRCVYCFKLGGKVGNQEPWPHTIGTDRLFVRENFWMVVVLFSKIHQIFRTRNCWLRILSFASLWSLNSIDTIREARSITSAQICSLQCMTNVHVENNDTEQESKFCYCQNEREGDCKSGIGLEPKRLLPSILPSGVQLRMTRSLKKAAICWHPSPIHLHTESTTCLKGVIVDFVVTIFLTEHWSSLSDNLVSKNTGVT